MKYLESGFRSVYDNFISFSLDEEMRKKVTEYPGIENSNCVLAVGFADAGAAVRLKLIALGWMEDHRYKFYEGAEHLSEITIEELGAREYDFLDKVEGDLGKRYEMQIGNMNPVSEEVAYVRSLEFLDHLRDSVRIDEMDVILTRKGLENETARVVVTGLGENCLIGRLLKSPEGRFGVAEGDEIACILSEIEDGSIRCIANLTPSRRLTEDDLFDGTMLKQAIERFIRDRSEDRYVDVLEILRDSEMWVPCEMDTDEKGLRMKPQIIRGGGHLYMPLFSTEEEMGVFGEKYVKVRKPMLFWIEMVQKMEVDLHGMVVDPFGRRFTVRKDVLPVIKNMKSLLIKN